MKALVHPLRAVRKRKTKRTSGREREETLMRRSFVKRRRGKQRGADQTAQVSPPPVPHVTSSLVKLGLILTAAVEHGAIRTEVPWVEARCSASRARTPLRTERRRVNKG